MKARLRPLDPDRDGEALHAIFGDEESCRYMTGPAFKTVEETIAQLKEWTKGLEDFSWVVVEDEALPSPVLDGRGERGEGFSSPARGGGASEGDGGGTREKPPLSAARTSSPQAGEKFPSPGSLRSPPSSASGRGGRALGRIALIPRGRDIYECACMIVPAARGKNLAARALAIAIDHAFDDLGARRIFADADPDNIPSIRTFEKLGFRHEGVARANWETHIGVRDSVILALIRTDPRVWRGDAASSGSG